MFGFPRDDGDLHFTVLLSDMAGTGDTGYTISDDDDVPSIAFIHFWTDLLGYPPSYKIYR